VNEPLNEAEAVRQRYGRRRVDLDAHCYHMLNPAVWQAVQERQRALLRLLARVAPKQLSQIDLLEVGCGSGGNLLELLRFGFDASHLRGIELLEERHAQARRNLPAVLELTLGDACEVSIAAASFDIVFVSTVFSSLLDDAFQQRLADAMWRWVRPGGAVLWYDFTVDNPRNPDVRGVPLSRVHALFPQGRIYDRRVTLAPPISRRVCRISPAAYGLFNALPFLRTHLLCWIAKPVFEPFAAQPGVMTTNAQVDALRDIEGV
jgi:SAM-dependent methyltransferase